MTKVFKIETKRLILGPIKSNYIPKIVEYAGNKKVADALLTLPHPYQEEDAIYWMNLSNQGLKNGDHYIFGIFLKDYQEFIGGIGLHLEKEHNRAELGYWIAEPFWHQGYATEAAGGAIKFGFEELGLHKIMANHLPENTASGKVMINNGMVKEGVLKDHIRKNGKYETLVQYGILKSEHQKTQ